MKKRWMASALIVCLSASLLSLAGCGEKKEENSSGGVMAKFDGELERNVTIRVLENDTAIEQGYFQKLLDAFNEKYKEYNIVAVDAKVDQYMDLANDGPYGYGPDVLYQANDMLMKYVDGKHILPLPVEKLECYDKVTQAAWDAYKTELSGVTYYCGVPVNVQSPMMYYRKDLLPEGWETEWDSNQNGTPDMFESWNAMYAYSKQIREQDPSHYGYMKSLDDAYFALGYLFSYGAYVFGDGNTNPEDIGIAADGAEKGAWVIKQLASLMNEECIDDTITKNSYSRLASGTYFATMTTPDVYTLFLKELTAEYKKKGLSEEDAGKLAAENLVMTDIPKLPASGDLSEENPDLIDCKVMGGINGYAVSAYTQAPKACLAFVDFATSYENMMLRNELLGIVPARSDAASDAKGLVKTIYDNLDSGKIVIMPSIQAVAQIWTPLKTYFSDIAKDAFRTDPEKKYKDLAALKSGLETAEGQIHDAIFTLKK